MKKKIVDQPIYKEFIERKGIIHPIRTQVLEKCQFEIANLNGVAEIVVKGRTNAIVGYFAAHDDFDPNDPKRTIGFSMIRPSDYENSVLEISKIRAIAMSMEKTGKKSIANSAISEFYVIDDDICYCNLVYVFANPIRDQFERFVERCKRYFKK